MVIDILINRKAGDIIILKKVGKMEQIQPLLRGKSKTSKYRDKNIFQFIRTRYKICSVLIFTNLS